MLYVDREEVSVEADTEYKEVVVRKGISWSLTLQPDQAHQLSQELARAANRSLACEPGDTDETSRIERDMEIELMYVVLSPRGRTVVAAFVKEADARVLANARREETDEEYHVFVRYESA
jgi:hypothetical protein